jgi:hypothetical protein
LGVGMLKPHAILGPTRPRNVRCHQGHWSWSWPVWPQIEVYRVENHILQETELGEYLSHIDLVGGVCVFGLRLGGRRQCDLHPKHKPNAPTSRGIMDKYSPDRMLSRNFVSHSILYSTIIAGDSKRWDGTQTMPP